MTWVQNSDSEERRNASCSHSFSRFCVGIWKAKKKRISKKREVSVHVKWNGVEILRLLNGFCQVLARTVPRAPRRPSGVNSGRPSNISV